MGLEFDAALQFLALCIAQFGRGIGRKRVPPEGWPDRQAIQVLQDVSSGRLLSAPPGGNRGDSQFLPQQPLAEAGQECHERQALRQTAPQRVGHRDVPRPHRLQQPRHTQGRIVVQFQRITKLVLHPAQNDMHRFKAAQGLEIDAVVAHGEVLALDEHVAQVAGQVTLFKIRLVVGALREQNHSRIIRGLRRQRRLTVVGAQHSQQTAQLH